MAQTTTVRGDGVARDLLAHDVIWFGAPYVDGTADPARVELFAERDEAETYVESHLEDERGDWEPQTDGDGRRLVGADSEPVGVVGSVETSPSSPTPPFDGSALERLVPSDSAIRASLPLLHDPPAVERETVPFSFLDLVLFSERGHLRLEAGAASDDAARLLEELRAYAGKAVAAATAAADDRVARNRIEELDDYLRIKDGTARYGKPRYRLAKRLTEWGGDTSRYAVLELWLLVRLLIRLYPEHVSWEPGYDYHDDH